MDELERRKRRLAEIERGSGAWSHLGDLELVAATDELRADLALLRAMEEYGPQMAEDLVGPLRRFKDEAALRAWASALRQVIAEHGDEAVARRDQEVWESQIGPVSHGHTVSEYRDGDATRVVLRRSKEEER